MTNREHLIGESDLIWLKTSIRKRDDIRYWKNSDWEEVEYDSDVTWVIYPNNCLDISQSLLRMPPDDSLGRYKRNDPILQSLDEEEGQCVPPMIIEKIVTHYFDEEFGLGTCKYKECKHEEDTFHFIVVDEGIKFKDSKLLKSKKMEQMIVKSCEITDSMTLMMFYPVDLKSDTIQYFFMNQVSWILVDWETETVKSVSPVVYPIGIRENVDFTFTVKRRKSKNFLKRICPLIYRGDFNGGYSDAFLFHAGMENELTNDEIMFRAHSPTRISDMVNFEHPIICSYRPFPSNPDLFQVKLLLTKTGNPSKVDNMFGFVFKIVEEFTESRKKLKESLENKNFTDCFIVNKW